MDDITDTLINGTRAQIEEKIDVESFARFCLLNEFVKTIDFDYSSVFFYYKDGKLYAGPAWDYDLSMGNVDEKRTPSHYATAQPDGLHCSEKHFYQWLYSRYWFFDEVRKVYLESRDYLDSIGADGGMIDYLHTTYARFINRNFKTAGWNVAAYYKNLNKVPFSTYSQNADYFKNWCSDRAEWLNSYYTEDVVEYALGDSDSNGSLDIMDATAIQRYLAQYELKRYYPTAADVNGNGIADILDATGIQRYLAGYSSTIAFEKIMFGKTE